MTMLGRLTCLFRRQHNYRLRGKDDRVFMECMVCGYRSRGWEMGPKARPIEGPTPRQFRLWLDDWVPPPTAEVANALDPGAESREPADELRLQIDS